MNVHTMNGLSSSLTESDLSPTEARDTHGKAVGFREGTVSRKISQSGPFLELRLSEYVGETHVRTHQGLKGRRHCG